MSMRTSSALIICVLLAACGSAKAPDAALNAADEAAASANGMLFCATDGAANMTRTCTSERIAGPDGTTVVIRHANGGFRRLRIVTDGRGVVSADGAEVAQVALVKAGFIDVTVAGDRYRLPARVADTDQMDKAPTPAAP